MQERETKCFYYNGKALILPVLLINDRVKLKNYSTMKEQPKGTVIDISEDEFFIDIKWDKPYYPLEGSTNGKVELGTKFLLPSLISFNE